MAAGYEGTACENCGDELNGNYHAISWTIKTRVCLGCASLLTDAELIERIETKRAGKEPSTRLSCIDDSVG